MQFTRARPLERERGEKADPCSISPRTAGIIRGYGNIFGLAFRPRVQIATDLMLNPHLGGFFWDTKVTAQAAGFLVDVRHEWGGVTGGIGIADRLWRGLEAGLGVNYFRGMPTNNAVLYSDSVDGVSVIARGDSALIYPRR